jgi:hypothetical protein
MTVDVGDWHVYDTSLDPVLRPGLGQSGRAYHRSNFSE